MFNVDVTIKARGYYVGMISMLCFPKMINELNYPLFMSNFLNVGMCMIFDDRNYNPLRVLDFCEGNDVKF